VPVSPNVRDRIKATLSLFGDRFFDELDEVVRTG
jgi:hypothetical protein